LKIIEKDEFPLPPTSYEMIGMEREEGTKRWRRDEEIGAGCRRRATRVASDRLPSAACKVDKMFMPGFFNGMLLQMSLKTVEFCWACYPPCIKNKVPNRLTPKKLYHTKYMLVK
jgi:hypothetical protein